MGFLRGKKEDKEGMPGEVEELVKSLQEVEPWDESQISDLEDSVDMIHDIPDGEWDWMNQKDIWSLVCNIPSDLGDLYVKLYPNRIEISSEVRSETQEGWEGHDMTTVNIFKIPEQFTKLEEMRKDSEFKKYLTEVHVPEYYQKIRKVYSDIFDKRFDFNKRIVDSAKELLKRSKGHPYFVKSSTDLGPAIE